MEKIWILRVVFILSSLILVLIGGWYCRLRPENLAKFEPWPRNRLWGMILGWVALIICVPHAQVVSPGFLQPLLWPLAIVLPVLSYFHLDYLLARSVGGLAILGAYYYIHLSFDLHSPGAPLLAVLAWIFGLGGIWVSGKPCALRDWIRAGARSSRWRIGSAAFLWLLAAVLLVSAIAANTPGKGI